MAERTIPDGESILPLSIEELEAGVQVMDRGDTDCRAFWDLNAAAFRRTVVIALRETSEVLESQHLPPAWQKELEDQVRLLRHYIEASDHCIAGRA